MIVVDFSSGDIGRYNDNTPIVQTNCSYLKHSRASIQDVLL